MVTRTCSSCSKDLPKSEYSKKQWSKKVSQSKCKTCVEGGEVTPAPTQDDKTPVAADTAVAKEVVDTKAEEEANKAAEEQAKKEAEEAE